MSSLFLESPRFPDSLAYWARGGVCFNTSVSASSSGREQRNIVWQYGRGQWDLQNTFRSNGGVSDLNSIQTLRNFFRVCKGQAYGFRFRDFTDYFDEASGILGAPVVSLSQAVSPTGVGLGIPMYQMFKAYISAPLADYRIIAKPYQTTVTRNGSAVVQGTSPGQCQTDPTTGLVTFTADSSAAALSWTSGASTSFSVSAVPANWAIGTTLYFAGVVGDTNSVLNGSTAVVTSISGTVVTVNANTAGLALSSGTVSRFPQPTEVLGWTGTFDTPCRFGTDQFTPQMDVGGGGLYGFQSLTIVEIRL